MEKSNRYRNRIKPMAVVRLGFVVALIGSLGVFIVTTRNRHVLKGDEIRKVEVRTTALTQEIEMWELRIASVKDRDDLKRRLRWMGSNLKEIETDKVFRLQSRDHPVDSSVSEVL